MGQTESQPPVVPSTSSWYTAQLSGASLSSVNKVGITQFRLFFAKDDRGVDLLKFFSGNSADANIPKLVIK